MTTKIEQLALVYEHLWAAHQDESFAILDPSLIPCPYTLLYEVTEKTGIKPDYTLLDIGCGRGNYSCELAHKYGCKVVGLDPVVSNSELAQNSAIYAGLNDQVTFQQGIVERLPCSLVAYPTSRGVLKQRQGERSLCRL